MQRLLGVVAVGALLLTGTAKAQPPVYGQEDAREAALRQKRGVPYVDLSRCSAENRAAQERTQLHAALHLATPDRGPAISGGACRVKTEKPKPTKLDDRFRR